MKTLICLFLVCCICCFSCGKEESPIPAPSPKTKKELLCMKSLKMIKRELNWMNGVWENNPVDPNEADDIYTFKTNNVLEITYGTKNPFPPFILDWSFDATETKITWLKVTWEINTLTETQVVLTEIPHPTIPQIALQRITFERI